jgi:hypothetical protein
MTDIDPLLDVRQPGGIYRWKGTAHRFKDGSVGVVRQHPTMCANGRVNLTLSTPSGELFLTTNELMANLHLGEGMQ